jgi:hypothetical protein
MVGISKWSRLRAVADGIQSTGKWVEREKREVLEHLGDDVGLWLLG